MPERWDAGAPEDHYSGVEPPSIIEQVRASCWFCMPELWHAAPEDHYPGVEAPFIIEQVRVRYWSLMERRREVMGECLGKCRGGTFITEK